MDTKMLSNCYFNHSKRTIDLNAKNCWGNTALMFACMYGNTEVVKLFLDRSKRDIDFNAKDKYGKTAFELACKKRHKDVVQLILKYAKAKAIDVPIKPQCFSQPILDLIDMYHKNSA